MSEKRDSHVSVLLTTTDCKRLKKLADKEQRTVSSTAGLLISRALDEIDAGRKEQHA